MVSYNKSKILYFIGIILAFNIQISYLIWSITNLITLEYSDTQFNTMIFFLSIDIFIIIIGAVAFGIDIKNDFKKINKTIYIIIPFIITLISVFGLSTFFDDNFSYEPFLKVEISICFTMISISAAIMIWGGLGIINEIIDDRM